MKNNTTKKASAKKKLLPAAGSLLISAAMLGTSTYAWFTMNKDVKVQNMQVKAKAEGGLLISETQGTDGVWDDEANTKAESGALIGLYPTSTADGNTWYHATSKSAGNAADASLGSGSAYKASGYTTLAGTTRELQAADAGNNGKKDVFYTGSGTTEADYYVKYTYYLKTSSDEQLTGLAVGAGKQNVAITEVTVNGVDGTSGSGELDKALRVGVQIGGKFYIFAPVEGADTTYFVNASGSATNAIDSHSSHTADGVAYTMTEPTALTSLPNRASDGTPVYIYMWYEGEDENCKSDNITANLDTLTVNVRFSLLSLSGSETDKGV